MWTRWRCRRCYNDIPAGLRGKYRQAIAAKSGEWSTGSATSSGEEDRKTRSLEAENKELRIAKRAGYIPATEEMRLGRCVVRVHGHRG